MNIEQQKAIADELLGCLEIIAPHTILAGGAPRDWHMGNTCNDLDIYLSLPEGLQGWRLEEMIRKVLPEGVKDARESFMSGDNPMYKHMEDLQSIYYFSYKGIDFQIILLRNVKAVYNAVDNMSCSICKAWYKYSTINLTEDFILTLGTGIMFLKDGYKWNDYHPAKMVERFADGDGFVKGSRQGAVGKIVYRFLKDYEA